MRDLTSHPTEFGDLRARAQEGDLAGLHPDLKDRATLSYVQQLPAELVATAVTLRPVEGNVFHVAVPTDTHRKWYPRALTPLKRLMANLEPDVVFREALLHVVRTSHDLGRALHTEEMPRRFFDHKARLWREQGNILLDVDTSAAQRHAARDRRSSIDTITAYAVSSSSNMRSPEGFRPAYRRACDWLGQEPDEAAFDEAVHAVKTAYARKWLAELRQTAA